MESVGYKEGLNVELSRTIITKRLEQEELEKETWNLEKTQEKSERRKKRNTGKEYRLEGEERAAEWERLKREDRVEKLRMEHESKMGKLKIQGLTNHSNGARKIDNESSIERMI